VGHLNEQATWKWAGQLDERVTRIRRGHHNGWVIEKWAGHWDERVTGI